MRVFIEQSVFVPALIKCWRFTEAQLRGDCCNFPPSCPQPAPALQHIASISQISLLPQSMFCIVLFLFLSLPTNKTHWQKKCARSCSSSAAERPQHIGCFASTISSWLGWKTSSWGEIRPVDLLLQTSGYTENYWADKRIRKAAATNMEEKRTER